METPVIRVLNGHSIVDVSIQQRLESGREAARFDRNGPHIGERVFVLPGGTYMTESRFRRRFPNARWTRSPVTKLSLKMLK